MYNRVITRAAFFDCFILHFLYLIFYCHREANYTDVKLEKYSSDSSLLLPFVLPFSIEIVQQN